MHNDDELSLSFSPGEQLHSQSVPPVLKCLPALFAACLLYLHEGRSLVTFSFNDECPLLLPPHSFWKVKGISLFSAPDTDALFQFPFIRNRWRTISYISFGSFHFTDVLLLCNYSFYMRNMIFILFIFLNVFFLPSGHDWILVNFSCWGVVQANYQANHFHSESAAAL